MGTSLKCALLLRANAKLAQRLKRNHRHVIALVKAFAGVSRRSSRLSKSGMHDAGFRRSCAKKARCCQLWPGVGSSFCLAATRRMHHMRAVGSGWRTFGAHM
ncbi:Unknown protein sequence [Pseudomonas coronafaciens pv. oryzae]|nr:Unknown protein sequence [Pseudomonas coronafaciens pv. oryzae]